ncbi:MAG: hypothetical protein ACE5PV_09110 [Candidatus Poribacteria bacterium]
MLSPDLKKRLYEVVKSGTARKPAIPKIAPKQYGEFEDVFPGQVITT